jgi:hypothetical protein
MEHWGTMVDDMLSSCILNIKVEVIVHKKKMVIDGCRLCSELDFLRIRGLENALDGLLVLSHVPWIGLYIDVISTYEHL